MFEEVVCVVERCLKPPRTYGLCAKHYEDHLRSKMGPCAVEGCTKTARSKGLCNVHYRRRLLETKPKCRVENCGRPTVSGDLCDTHRLRLQHHGHLGFTRSEDWGSKSKHPLMHTWKWLSRKGSLGVEWQDFWRLVADVGERPSPQHKLKRPNPSKPYGPLNWVWWQAQIASENAKAYQKEWRQRNPRAAHSSTLRKSYRVDADWYDAKMAEQRGTCAICRRAETAVDRSTQAPRRLAVDHDHTTGAVRGLLCSKCNTALGAFQDSIDLLLAAGEYLERYSSAGPSGAGVLPQNAERTLECLLPPDSPTA